MLSPSSGSAVYRGYNIFTDLKGFRKDLGLCPQHNLLHLDLSVIDQLIFFGMVNYLIICQVSLKISFINLAFNKLVS